MIMVERNLKNLFGLIAKSVPAIDQITEVTREGIPKAFIPYFFYKESFLNGGLYTKLWLMRSLFAQNVERNLKVGNLKIGSIAQMNADLKYCIEKHQIKRELDKKKNVNIVEKNFMLLDGKLKKKEGNIVHKNVIGEISPKKLQEKEIHSILMEEQKNMQKHFIYQLDGEIYERRFMKERIGRAEIAEIKVGNYMPIIKFQLGNAKTLLKNQILSPCVEFAIKKDIVSNNRQEVQNEFYR